MDQEDVAHGDLRVVMQGKMDPRPPAHKPE
jgi:hypothetical protein